MGGGNSNSQQPVSAAADVEALTAEEEAENGSMRRAGGMISAAELDEMLSGLRSSLRSIQESRAQYVAVSCGSAGLEILHLMGLLGWQTGRLKGSSACLGRGHKGMCNRAAGH